MRQYLAWLTPLLLAPAMGCGGGALDDQEVVLEKDEDALSVQLSGWRTETRRQDSAHSLGNDLSEVIEIDAPDTATKFRIRFSSVRMEKDYDFLVIQDEWGAEIERITGSYRNYVSRTINGKKAKLVLQTDGSVASWGFSIDQIRHRGCFRGQPTPMGLEPQASCTTLLEGIRTLAEAEVRRRFTDGYYGGIRPFVRTSAQPELAGAKAHSETNTQVAGVDEADIVKTDGDFVYTIAGRQLRQFRAWPASDLELLQAINIEGWAKELFIEGTRAIVLSGVQGDRFSPGPIGGPIFRMMPIWWNPEAFTKITVIDFSSGTPRIQSEILLSGQYQTARRVGAALRVMMSRQLEWPALSYQPEGQLEGRELEAAVDQLEADAVRIVRARSLADWLPESYRIVNGQRVALAIDCTSFLVPERGDQPMGLTSIATVDLGAATPTVQETSALVQAQTLYQSLDTLYVTGTHNWSCGDDWGTQGQYTYVHGFDVRAPNRASYLASGAVQGGIDDQFSMDEHRGFLRVATTQQRWSAPTPAEQSVSQVHVLERQGRRLVEVGTTADMAPGERIFGVRFMGDKGYVVTFRQVDPLFTIDLSNPRSPRIVGELKVPGFSSYLHPLGPDHLFTIGQDFEPDGTTRNGVALSIFDVSNFAQPRLVHKAVIGTTQGYSEALHEHKAFTMYQAPGATDWLLAIPFTDYTAPGTADFWQSFKSSLKVFRVSPAGIIGLGELDHADFFRQNQSDQFGWWYQPNVRRGVFVEDFVYAISDAGLSVARISDLTRVIAQVEALPQFEDPTPTPTIVTDEVSVEPGLAIPDNREGGITSVARFGRDLAIQDLSVEIEVTHTYRGDLRVVLEHDGVTEVLHDRTGGSQDNLTATFISERFRGLRTTGDFTLRVEDRAAADTGSLVRWRLIASGTEDTSAPTVLDRTFSQTTAVAIPDAVAAGVRSTIEVPDAMRVDALELTLDIRHTYRGDLRVVLEHDGVQHVVHDKTGGSADDLALTLPISAFADRDARGTWTLIVSDLARQDTGELRSWSLHVTGEQLR